jgi:uncharacterized membrane protein YphA (DoxX/SURF4 family)
MTPAADTLAGLGALWNAFFHYPDLPLSLAVFRILFGVLLATESVGLIRAGHELFSSARLAPARESIPTRFGPLDARINLFLFFCNSNYWIRTVFIIHTAACISLACGLFTRIAALMVFLNFASRSKQNWYITQSGDNVAKFLSLLLIFSNAGGALSLDSYFGLSWLGGATFAASQWPLRLMQVQISIVYLRTVQWKLRDPSWIDGTAVFHALHRNPHLRWNHLPKWTSSGALVALMTWGTLLTEGAIGIFVWFRDTRWIGILVAVAFHGTLEVFLKLKYFQYMMIICLVLFVPSATWITVSKGARGLLFGVIA